MLLGSEFRGRRLLITAVLAALTIVLAYAAVPANAQIAPGGAVRINAGGSAFTTFAGDAFAADANFTGGSTYSTTQPIAGTSDGPLYQNERWGQFSYAIPVTPGTYDVKLHFVEIYYGTTVAGGNGKRVFGMDVLDTPASPDLSNIDVYAAVGARTPYVRTVSGVTVTDGTLDLRSVYGSADDPEIAAIEVIPTGPPPAPTVTGQTPAPNATGVAASAKPSVTFSTDMDASTITNTSFVLRKPDNSAVNASVAYDSASRTATLSPVGQPLAYSTTYTAQLATTIKSAAGQALASAVSWSFTTGAQPPPDNVPPTITLTAPTNGATITGSTTLTATAADNVGVTDVQFMVDGAPLGSPDTAAPYSKTWDTFGIAAGDHTISAVAGDAAGNHTTSTVITVTVANPKVDPTGLVGAWAFDEGTGTTAADLTANHNNGTISGAQWTDGRFGNALDFDGTAARVNVPDSASLDLTTAFTMEAWARPSFSGGWRTAIMKEASGKLAYAMYGSAWNDRPSAHLTTNTEFDTRGTATLPLNTWTHLASTWDGSTLRLYVNGTQVSSSSVGGTIAASTQALRFGGNSIWGEYFKGSLDEIRIYSRALSASEVNTDMTSPVRTDAPAPPGPDVKGQFSAPQTWPLVPVHIASTNDGRVVVWDGFDAALNSERLWDPKTNTFTPIPTGRNLFCAGHVTLPDGRLFIAGGHNGEAYKGLADTHIFNPKTMSWFRGPDMARTRWYPTATTLPDGRVFVIAGDNVTFAPPGSTQIALTNASDTLPEIYNVENNTWTSLPSAQRRSALYPFMFVLPNGKLFDAGPDMTNRTLDLSTGLWSTVTTSPISGHSAVMYRPGKILKSGTWSDPDFPNQTVTNRAVAIDMNDASPTWRDVAPMHYPRSFHTLTVLPDGKVLASGGGESSDGVDESKGVLTPEIWDPDTDTWTTTASHQRSRLYHSSALLLQDGRVLLAGGGAFGSATNETNAEIYSPPYLFKGGSRPTITDAPAVASLGQTMTVTTPDAARIQKVSLLRIGSVTHNFDMDQRFMWLNVRPGAAPGTLSVDAPTNPNIAITGWYYMYLLDDKGVPSQGSIIKINKPASDSTAPSVPGSVTATANDDDVTVNWSASTDDTGVTEYRVYRSTTSGFTPGTGNLIATVPSGTSYADNNRPAGTYYYKVAAADAAGNASAPSSEASATVAADTTLPTVSLTAPAAGTVSGTVNVTASASDNRGVTSVQFKLDGANLGSADTSSPYSVSWDTKTASNGSHDLTAVATDAALNTKTSATVTVNVDNGSPPTVSLTAPTAGSTVSNTVSVAANAGDDKGVASVQFKLDGANLGSADTTSPYSVSWDTKTASNGSHQLTAVATDTDGNTTTSASVGVTVSNTVVQPTGLVAAYGFEEGTGTSTADSSGNGLNGTITAATWATAGKFGKALSFNGTSAMVSVNNATGLGLGSGMTLEAWVNPTTLTNWRTVLLKEQSASNLAYALYANTDTNRPAANVFTSAETDTRGTAKLATGAWSHLAATYDGATLRLYVNGTLVSSKAATGAIQPGTRALRIGGNSIWSEWFAGLIDEVRVYNRALSATEIQNDMTVAVKP